MSTISVNTIRDTSGVQQYLVKAWSNINGTGTVAIRASGNISSITDNGVGDYTYNITNAIDDVNFALNCSAGNDTATASIFTWPRVPDKVPQTTTSARIGLYANSAAAVDRENINMELVR